MYPIAINHVALVLPRHLVNGTIGWMSACGASGSALLPFITGTISSNFGIESLQPLCVFQNSPSFFFDIHSIFFGSLIAMMIVLSTVWSFVPKKPDPFPFAVQLRTIETDKVDSDQEFSGEI